MINKELKLVSEATLKRLPAYWRLLKFKKDNGCDIVSCTKIADELDLTAIQVRKDLACTGISGKPKVGYVVDELIESIENFLGWNNLKEAFLVGVGNLGKALLGYKGFEEYGLRIVLAFDNDPQTIGLIIHGREVMPLDRLYDLAERMHVQIGIITVPAAHAQEVADLMVLSNIKAIWNFAPVKLQLRPDIILENVELSASLAVLSNKLTRTRNNPL